VGFTDIIKGPLRASELHAADYERGKQIPRDKLEHHRLAPVIFTFKKKVAVLSGPFAGHGLLASQTLGGAPLYLTPGAYAASDDVDAALDQLPRRGHLIRTSHHDNSSARCAAGSPSTCRTPRRSRRKPTANCAAIAGSAKTVASPSCRQRARFSRQARAILLTEVLHWPARPRVAPPRNP
jgi:hypothetical protein